MRLVLYSARFHRIKCRLLHTFGVADASGVVGAGHRYVRLGIDAAGWSLGLMTYGYVKLDLLLLNFRLL